MSIISASRRTDIPALYGDWFMKHLEEGEFYTRNPYNNKQLSHITFNKEDIDCIVLWTKNPIPFMKHIEKLKEYPFYFQFTLTPYSKKIEPNLPEKKWLIAAFKELSEKTNKQVIWRYDPIIFTPQLTVDYHKEIFSKMAELLKGYTDRCVISFVDNYDSTKMQYDSISDYKHNAALLEDIGTYIANEGRKNGMTVYTCAETIDYGKTGLTRGRCIDPDYIRQICGYPIKASKDSSQRGSCNCVESIDIGVYNSCTNGCRYCYATRNNSLVPITIKQYDLDSPILCDRIGTFERYTEKKLHSLRDFKREESEMQITLF